MTSVCNQCPEGPEPLLLFELIREVGGGGGGGGGGGAWVTSFIPEQQRAQIWSRELRMPAHLSCLQVQPRQAHSAANWQGALGQAVGQLVYLTDHDEHMQR